VRIAIRELRASARVMHSDASMNVSPACDHRLINFHVTERIENDREREQYN